MARMRQREQDAVRAVGLDPTSSFIEGAGQSQFDPVTGQSITRLAPQIGQFQRGMFGESLEAQSAGQAGRASVAETGLAASGVASGLFGELRGLASGDPLDIAEQQFQRMEGILAPERERRRASLEGRLHSQGRLGGTGGALELSELEGQFNRDRQQFLNQQLQSANQIQNQNLQTRGGLAAQAGMFGADIQQGQFGQGVTAGQTGTNIAGLAAQLSQAAPQLANQLLAGELSALDAVTAFNTQNRKQGTATSRALGGIGGALGAAGAFATNKDPLEGAQAGQQIGRGIGGFF